MVELGTDGLDVRGQLEAGQVGAEDIGAEEGFGFDGHGEKEGGGSRVEDRE